jgi:hypothetical protein
MEANKMIKSQSKYKEVVNNFRVLLPNNKELENATDNEVITTAKELLNGYISTLDINIKTEEDKLDFLDKAFHFNKEMDSQSSIQDKEKYKTAIINLVKDFLIKNDYDTTKILH